MKRPGILLLSTADWDNPFWTNKQHVAVQLARRGHPVFYVESLGLRRPSASKADISRIFRRLTRALKPPRMVRPGLWVWSPLVLPFHGSAVVRDINRAILKLSLKFWHTIIHFRAEMLWTYSPMTTEVLDVRRFKTIVYHAVDDVAAQPGMPREAILSAEAMLLAASDIVFVTSKNLFEKHKHDNREVHYFSNVADFDHFSLARSNVTAIPEDLAALPSPRLGLIGAISGYKVDFELLIKVANLRPDWSIVLIGAVGEGDPWTNAENMQSAENIHILGPRPYSQLPAYLKGLDVAILANHSNEYTKSMFPMKFFEYLAAGKPVVSTPLPALSDYGSIASFADSAENFVVAVEEVLAGGGAPLEERLEAARENTYESRMQKMMDVVERIHR